MCTLANWLEAAPIERLQASHEVGTAVRVGLDGRSLLPARPLNSSIQKGPGHACALRSRIDVEADDREDVRIIVAGLVLGRSHELTETLASGDGHPADGNTDFVCE